MTNRKPKITVRLKRVQEFLNRQKYKYDVLEVELQALPQTAEYYSTFMRITSKMEQIKENVQEAATLFELEDPFRKEEEND